MNQFNPQMQPQINPYLQRNPYLQQQNIQQNGIIWVQGIEGAKAHLMNPNSNAQLMDSENDGIMYIKTCDSAGMCNLRVFKYEEVTDSFSKPAGVNLEEYVRKDELQSLIQNMMGGMQNESAVSTVKSNSKSKATITE